jgi:putative membrane protein
MLLARRALLAFAAVAPTVLSTRAAFAVEALPDTHFVGYAQHINDFEIAGGRLALARSSNESVRNFATHMIDQHTDAAEFLAKARAEAGVMFAPDPHAPPHTAAMLQRLGALYGPDFDMAYGHDQLVLLSEAEAQYGAYSQNGNSAPLRRYAERELPKVKRHLEATLRLPGAR